MQRIGSPAAKKKFSSQLAESYTQYGMFIILLVMVVMSSVLSDVFLTQANIANVLRNMSVVALVAFGITYLLILGMIDLSAGSVMALSGCTCCLIIRDTGSVAAGMVAGVVVGGVFGLLNGTVVAYFGIPAFIMTLATQNIARGAALLVTGGNPVSGMGDSYKMMGQGYVDRWKLIPTPIVIMLVLFAATWVLLNRTRFGRHVLAVGGNSNAAKASGVGIKKTVIRAFLLDGLLVGLAGVMLMSRLNSGQPNGALNYEFDAITAAVVGGTSLMGGIGNMQGTFVGCMIVGVLNNVMNLKGVSSFWQMIVRGSIIALAVIIDYKTKQILQKKEN